jgi:dienelactone hydrolase
MNRLATNAAAFPSSATSGAELAAGVAAGAEFPPPRPGSRTGIEVAAGRQRQAPLERLSCCNEQLWPLSGAVQATESRGWRATAGTPAKRFQTRLSAGGLVSAMARALAIGFVVTAALFAASEEPVPLQLRGKSQMLVRLHGAAQDAGVAVIFLPGDGGWRGAAISMSKNVAAWGYDVYGFDTRKYLETFSANGTHLSREQLAEDVRRLADEVYARSRKPAILVGWSQGAAMAVAAAAASEGNRTIRGVATLGLPESAVLGWDWKAALSAIARREPDQPKFLVRPLMASVTPKPIWMIHGSADEYTSPGDARALFAAAAEPKHLDEIVGANHRFDGHQEELYRSLKVGLEWIARQ